MITFHLVAAHYPLLLFTTATITTTRYYDYYYCIMIILHYFILFLYYYWYYYVDQLYHHYYHRWSWLSSFVIYHHHCPHIRVYQLRCYRYHQYIDTSLLTENGRRPWRRPWRFSIGKSIGSHPYYIGVRRNWCTDVERICLCLWLSCNTGTLFNRRAR